MNLPVAMRTLVVLVGMILIDRESSDASTPLVGHCCIPLRVIRPIICALLIFIGVVLGIDARHGHLGSPLFTGGVIEPDYQAMCDYCRQHTAVDALFVVPPQEQEFRLTARRAEVVNFKGVAQLSSELGEWRDRLTFLLQIKSLNELPHQFNQVFEDLSNRYNALGPEHLRAFADHFQAGYIITTRDVSFGDQATQIFARGKYHLYEIRK